MSSPDPCFDRELRSMRLLIERTANGLLAFAMYDDIDIRTGITKELSETLSIPLMTVLLSSENNNPTDILKEIPNAVRSCLFFFNAEEAFPKFLGFVNLQREQLLQTKHALVFWVREEGMRRIAGGAPDFWAWRSQVFDFRSPASCRVDVGAPDPHDERTAMFSTRDLRDQAGVLEDLKTPENPGRYRILGKIGEGGMGVVYSGRPDGTDEIGVETSLGRRLIQLGRQEDAEAALRRALEAARQGSDLAAQAETLQLLGNLVLEKGMTSEAEGLYYDALSIAVTMPRESYARQAGPIHRQLSAVDLMNGKSEAALEHALDSVRISETASDLPSLANALHQLGNVLSHQRKLHEAEDTYLKAIQLEQKLGMLRDLALTKYRLGRLYEKMGALQFAEGHLLDAIRSFKEEEMPDYEARAWGSLGRVYESRNDASRAKEAYNRAERLQTAHLDN